jgi:hypothetical protein
MNGTLLESKRFLKKMLPFAVFCSVRYHIATYFGGIKKYGP